MLDLETAELRQADVQTLNATTETLNHLVLVDVPAMVARIRELEAESALLKKVQAITQRQLDDEREAHAETFQKLVEADR